MATREASPCEAGARAMGQYGRTDQCREMGASSAFSIALETSLPGNLLAQICQIRFQLHRNFADQGKP